MEWGMLMPRPFSLLITLLLCLHSTHAQSSAGQQLFDAYGLHSAEYGQHIYDLIQEQGGLQGEAVLQQLSAANEAEPLTLPSYTPVEGAEDDAGPFPYGRDRTFVIARPYQNAKGEWKLYGSTCWALTPDGVMVTNYHVFDKGMKAGGAAVGYDLNAAYPVTEILVADQGADLAIFKVALPEGTQLKTFPLGDSAYIGDEIHLVSHPKSRYYYYSKGHVASYYLRSAYKGQRGDPRREWMLTETGYIPGSSGGAFFNDDGEIVGMVSLIVPALDPADPRDTESKDQIAIKVFEYAVPVKTIHNRVRFR